MEAIDPILEFRLILAVKASKAIYIGRSAAGEPEGTHRDLLDLVCLIQFSIGCFLE
jgi:hypothetical protein